MMQNDRRNPWTHPLLAWTLFAAAVAAIVFLPAPASAVPPAERQIQIEASSFAYTPGTISVNPGDVVTLELVATDMVHGLYLDGYGLSVTADPGQTARLTFVADKAGTFHFRCSVTCGPLHPFMLGRLNVGTNWLLWRALGLSLLVTIVALGKHKQRQERGATER